MKKQLVIIGVVAILVSVELSGCNEISNTANPEKNQFVGTWQTKTSNNTSIYNNTLILYTNGTLLFRSLVGKWDLRDNKLAMEIASDKGTINFIYDYIFSNNNRILTLTNSMDGSTVIWIKQ